MLAFLEAYGALPRNKKMSSKSPAEREALRAALHHAEHVSGRASDEDAREVLLALDTFLKQHRIDSRELFRSAKYNPNYKEGDDTLDEGE